jgi:Prophage protein (DUF1660)
MKILCKLFGHKRNEGIIRNDLHEPQYNIKGELITVNHYWVCMRCGYKTPFLIEEGNGGNFYESMFRKN